MVSPLNAPDKLDYKGIERLVDHILLGGVHGLFILGTTGEFPSLSLHLKREMITYSCSFVSKRVPILVGITDTCFAESINLAEFAANAGADALVLAPPYYFPAGQPELLEYLEHIVPRLPLPLFLYNTPNYTRISFKPETVLLASEIPGIIGLKDSSADMDNFHRLKQLLTDKKDFRLFVGREELLAETLVLGGNGGVCGGANLAPELYVDLYKASMKGDLKKVKQLHDKVMQISATIYSVGKYESSFIKGLKCSLNHMGICNDFMAEPFHRFRESNMS